jgi:hypothetical protein
VNLFVYGTLLFPEVLTALLGRVPAHAPAVAAGWRAAALPGRPYPGLVPAAGRRASGLVLSGLDDDECRLLDAYESDDYQLTTIVLDGGRSCSGYVWRHDVLPHDWSPKQFATTELGEYARRCARWRAAYLPQPLR